MTPLTWTLVLLSVAATLRLPEGVHGLPQETLLSDTENAYNPIPSPDGKMIAFVRTGRWEKGSGGQGRSNLKSEVMVMDTEGHLITAEPLADAFLQGWTQNGKQLICYRDHKYYLVSFDGKKSRQVDIPFDMTGSSNTKSVRGAYLPHLDAMVFVEYLNSSPRQSQRKPVIGVIRTGEKEVARFDDWSLGDMLVPSPDGRYIAAISDKYIDSHLRVYDTLDKSWADLGRIVIHPAITYAGANNDWEWMQASWNPWFADSSRLAFIANGSIVVGTPDGTSKETIAQIGDKVGLATPSPDGHSIAYVTFETQVHPTQPHWTFWGNTTIWVVPNAPGSRARAVTQRNADTTYCLRWLNSSEIVFDRFDEGYHFSSRHRLWKVRVDQ